MIFEILFLLFMLWMLIGTISAMAIYLYKVDFDHKNMSIKQFLFLMILVVL